MEKDLDEVAVEDDRKKQLFRKLLLGEVGERNGSENYAKVQKKHRYLEKNFKIKDHHYHAFIL